MLKRYSRIDLAHAAVLHLHHGLCQLLGGKHLSLDTHSNNIALCGNFCEDALSLRLNTGSDLCLGGILRHLVLRQLDHLCACKGSQALEIFLTGLFQVILF